MKIKELDYKLSLELNSEITIEIDLKDDKNGITYPFQFKCSSEKIEIRNEFGSHIADIKVNSDRKSILVGNIMKEIDCPDKCFLIFDSYKKDCEQVDKSIVWSFDHTTKNKTGQSILT